MTTSFTWDEISLAHQRMYENKLFGTVSCLVSAPTGGLTNYKSTVDAIERRRAQ